MMNDASAPSISVLVTVYNRDRYLTECLSSILESGWRDFEVIVVDDASTDGSWEIAKDFESRDERVRAYRNDTNLGDYPNRRRAADLATGQYIKYVDSDDVIYPHGLAVMAEAMIANPAAALGISHSEPEAERPYPWCLDPEQAWRKEFLGGGCLGAGPSGAMIKTAAFKEIGGFGNWGVLSDTHLWYRLSARWPVVLLPPGLVWWRKHDNQEFRSGDAKHAYLTRGFELTMQTLNSENAPLSASETSVAVKRARQHHARRLLAMALKSGRPIDAFRLARVSGLSMAELISGFAPYR
jgi:glycosyltransferase involved in cell wall biosynthesis